MEEAPAPEDKPLLEPSFGQFVWLWNRLQGLSTPALHTRIARWLETRWQRGDKRLALTIFRNAGKSTLVGLFCSWLLRRDPNLRILVLAAEQNLAAKMSRNIKRILERHPLTGALVPATKEVWGAEQFTIRRARELRDPSVMARGITANLTGSRADLVVCDDVEVPNTTASAALREDLRDRLTEVAYVLDPAGTQLYVGTPHSHHSIYNEKPLREMREDKPFLQGFARLKIPLVDSAGTSAWPERFDGAQIEAIRAQTGPLRFKSQMLLQPADPREMRLDPAQLVRYEHTLEDVSVQGELQIRLGGVRMMGSVCWWDPAFGHPEKGDASVVACVFSDAQGHWYLHAIRYMTIDPARLDQEDAARQLCRQVVAFCTANHQGSVSVESNGLGRFLPGTLQNVMRELGVDLSVRAVTASRNKTQRILEAFDPALASRRLHAHATVWDTPFVQEMREWLPERDGRDDGLDAVAGCLAAQPVRIRPLALGKSRAGPRGGGFTARTSFDV